MTGTGIVFLSTSTVAFIAAASAAKMWAMNSGAVWLAATLALYTIGNLVMLRLIREVGMGVALSLSAVVQLAAVNTVALLVFGERVSPMQAGGLALAVVAVAMITLPSAP